MNIHAIIAIPIRVIFVLAIVIYLGALLCATPFIWFYNAVVDG